MAIVHTEVQKIFSKQHFPSAKQKLKYVYRLCSSIIIIILSLLGLFLPSVLTFLFSSNYTF